MLIITLSLYASLRRPKYHPRERWAQTCVHDTELHKTVFGPATRRACNDYITKHSRKEESHVHKDNEPV